MRSIIAACLVLAGCSQIQTAETHVQTFTQADIANALAIAQAAGPAGSELVPCLTYIQSQLAASPQAATSGTAPTVGLATVFVQADLSLNKAANAISPNSQSAYEAACGPLVVHIMNQGMSISAQVGALAALMAR